MFLLSLTYASLICVALVMKMIKGKMEATGP